MRRRHEQPVAVAAAEADIGAALRQRDVAERLALRREHAHAAKLISKLNQRNSLILTFMVVIDKYLACRRLVVCLRNNAVRHELGSVGQWTI
jgi:hypothetical protein